MTGTSEATKELTLLRELVSTLQQENALLRQKVEALIRRVFGSSSERIDPAQLELLLQLGATPAPEVPRAEIVRSRPSRPPRAQRLPENLPVVEEVIDPEPALVAPQEWRWIGQEVSEQLDYEPARFLRRRLIRRKYVHMSDPDRAPIIAPLPEKLQERGVAGPGLLAHILVSKYCDHLPLYRQEQIFAQRHKIHLPRQTLTRWIELCAEWLQPIYEHIRTGVQADETPIEYLAPGNGQTKQGYLWTCSRPGGDVFYRWETSRAATCLVNVLGREFQGVVQCDGYRAYRAYRAFAERSQEIKLSGCWAHVRRKFHEACEQTPGRAGWILRQIQHLYRIESRLRESKAGPVLRQSVRSHQSRPIVERLRKTLVLFKSSRRHLP